MFHHRNGWMSVVLTQTGDLTQATVLSHHTWLHAYCACSYTENLYALRFFKSFIQLLEISSRFDLPRPEVSAESTRKAYKREFIISRKPSVLGFMYHSNLLAH